MTLRVVADNVEKLDVYNFQDIAACARRFADQLEQGIHGEPIRILVVLDMPDGIALNIWGENPSAYEMVGILEAAKFRAHEAIYED